MLESASRQPEITRITAVPSKYSDESGAEFIADRHHAIADCSAISLAVHDSKSGQPVGGVNFSKFDWRMRTAHIGYWIVAEARGRGYARRAMKLLLDWGITELGLREVVLQAEPNNHPSHRIAAEAGFTQVGRVHAKPTGVEREIELIEYIFRPDVGR